jgi:hypothetical protein
MRGYKARPPVPQHRKVVALLLATALSLHTRCAGRLAGADVTHLTVVPSLPRSDIPHPLERIVTHALALDAVPAIRPAAQLRLVAADAADVQNRREVSAGHYTAATRVPTSGHVLVVDDTWTTGGHAHSAALAARADHVSVLAAARWLSRDWPASDAFVRTRLHDAPPYDPRRCPWTGTDCP